MSFNRTCSHCASIFQVTASAVRKGGGKYCSRACAQAASYKRVENACNVCGKAFYPARYLQGIQKACSQSCASKARRTKRERSCLNCGATFFKVPSQFKIFKGAGKYCSRKCSYAGQVKESANKPTNDRWGRTGRKADTEWQRHVRERDNYTCQRCGKYEQYIHTHHVAPRARRPDLKHEVSNGKCLCGPCHQWVHWNPKEATALGLLSDETYERARNKPCRYCDNMSTAHGMCWTHVTRFRKYGDPLMTRRPGRPRPGDQPFRELPKVERSQS